jgi:hypothetical protein
MIFDCPYCQEENNILFGEEIKDLIRHGKTECKCDYCRKIFRIIQGKEMYEVQVKENIE